MKNDEKLFFLACYSVYLHGGRPRDVIRMLDGMIHHKRCWYLLNKWSNIGMYDYGVTLDLGWFSDYFHLPQRYKDVLNGDC